jgi:hypothetical protein
MMVTIHMHGNLRVPCPRVVGSWSGVGTTIEAFRFARRSAIPGWWQNGTTVRARVLALAICSTASSPWRRDSEVRRRRRRR